MEVTAEWIERVLYYRLTRMGRTNVFPHVTPEWWWECDMFSTTKTGYWSEYEIKVTRSDFFNDFKKIMVTSSNGTRRAKKYAGHKGFKTHNKHEMLAEGNENGPNYFWFCTPQSLVELDEIPDYAGLIEFPEPNSKNPSPHWGRYKSEIKKAPRLHSEKYGEERERKLHTQIPYRYQAAYFETVPALKREIEELKKQIPKD